MNYSIYDNYIAQAPDGTLVAGASVTVYLAGTTTLASLFSDEGTTAIDNPVTSGVNGRVTFYAESGPYDISVLYDAQTTEYKNVSIGYNTGTVRVLDDIDYSSASNIQFPSDTSIGNNGIICRSDGTDRPAITGKTASGTGASLNMIRVDGSVVTRSAILKIETGSFTRNPRWVMSIQDDGEGFNDYFSVDSLVVRPGRMDNVVSLGSATYRWSQVYAANSTISTSDETLKTKIEELTVKEKAVALEIKLNIGKYKMLDSVENKGVNARIHFGVGAQTVKSIFEKHGLDADNYSLFCKDTLEDGTERYGIRYDHLSMMILSAI